jgi:replicative DNA helicase
VAQKIVNGVNNGQETTELLAAVQNDVYAISLESESKAIITPRQHAERILNTVAKRMEKKEQHGIMTSIFKLNKMLNSGCGYQPGELVIMAAKTGKGKTAFALNQAKDIAVIQKVPTLYINTEMNEEQMDCRWMSMLSGIDHYKIATGQLSSEEVNKVFTIMNRMNDGGFHSVTEPNLTLNKLISMSRKFAVQKKCKVIVVDYIGRLDTLDAKLKEWEVLKQAAKKLKTLAQELKVTVIMLAQVTESEKLEGAKAMKNECDMYAYLRPLYEDELASMAEFNYCLDVQKNRSGPCKKIRLKFYGDRLTFVGEGDEKL